MSLSLSIVLNTMSSTNRKHSVAWFVLLAANTYTSCFKFSRSYLTPASYASLNILWMKSTEGFVLAWYFFFKLPSINRLIRLSSHGINLISSYILTFPFFSGRPEVILVISRSLHIVSFLRRLDLPVNTLISISSSYSFSNLDTSPS